MVGSQNAVQHRKWAYAVVAAIAITIPSSANSYSMTKPIRGPLHLNQAPVSYSSVPCSTSSSSHSSLLMAVMTPDTFEESLSSARTHYEEVNSLRKIRKANVVIKKNVRADISSGQAYPIKSSALKRRASPIQNRNMKTLEDEISGVKISSTPIIETPASKPKEKLHSGRSSTMPGFMNRNNSGRRESFRDGLNIARNANSQAKSNKIKKIHTSKKAVNKRKKANSEAMYASSASVPDSMIAFASEIHQVRNDRHML